MSKHESTWDKMRHKSGILWGGITEKMLKRIESKLLKRIRLTCGGRDCRTRPLTWTRDKSTSCVSLVIHMPELNGTSYPLHHRQHGHESRIENAHLPLNPCFHYVFSLSHNSHGAFVVTVKWTVCRFPPTIYILLSH